ncbi:MAG TPA: EAL domain-containing protein [Vicinamibacterales bacterium]|nr:EAL domain-containing protein [Vicinamibacterales bacterium]
MSVRGSLLVVDDNELNRDVLSRRLQHQGYAVTVACGGDDALALVSAAPYDLILLDVEMPGMSGLDVLNRLRATYSQTQLPVIMVTARAQGPDIVQAFKLGANDYVTKPIDFPVALARIETHLSHKWAVEDLRESEERYALAIDGANDGLWDWNLVTNEVHWSPRWKAILGLEPSEAGDSPDEWLTRVHPADVGRVKTDLSDHLASGSGRFESEHRMRHRNASYRWVRCRGAAVRTRAGAATRFVGSLTDITDAKVADALTGLPNRLLFEDLLDRALKRTARRRDYVFALLMLGLDRFRVVSDSLGPVTADQLLIAVARRLQTRLRSTDAVTPGGAGPQSEVASGFTLARLGGDEFTVLLEDIADASDAIRIAERLRQALEQPFIVEGNQVYTSATVGIAVSSTGYDRPEDMLRDAATALHRASAQGTARCELFDAAMRARAVSRLQLETELRNAIAERAFAVHYQPIISLRTGAIAGVEALVRWIHPQRGLVSPAEFIPVAEDTGMLVHIGRLVLSESCRQMVLWQEQFGPEAPSVVCVNVSCRQFAESDLATEIAAILRSTGLDSSRLHLEITESAFMGDMHAAQDTLSRLHSMGIDWSIDDFGTGYSSLSYLHRLQAGTLKVDRSFVSRMGREERGSEMVGAIMALAHNLGMEVVAEGVETPEQLAQLRRIGCDYMQGFLFSRPVDIAAMNRLIAAQPWRPSGDATAFEDILVTAPG